MEARNAVAEGKVECSLCKQGKEERLGVMAAAGFMLAVLGTVVVSLVLGPGLA